MADTWHIVLRDIMVILAAGAVISFSLFAALVLWQLYRLAIELREEGQPIVQAVLDTAETVRGAAHFVGERAVPPAVTSVGLTAGVFRVYQQLSHFYTGLRSNAVAPPPPPTTDGQARSHRS